MLEQTSLGETEPETIAHHYTAAALHERAVPFWFKAGHHALDRTALPEAIGHLRKALEWVQVLPAASERKAQELDIRITLAAAFLAYGGWAYGELPLILEPARALAEHTPHQRLVVLYYLWLYHWVKSETEEAVKLTDELVRCGEKDSHLQSLVAGLAARAMTECLMGEWKKAKVTGERFFETYSEERDGSLVPVLNHDLKCLVLSWAPYWHWALGEPLQAEKNSLDGLTLSRRLNHPFNLIWALTGGSCGLLVSGDTRTALDWNAEARAIAREQSMTFMEAAPCNWWGGMALIRSGDFQRGLEMSEIGMNNWTATGGYCQDPLGRTTQAYALGKLGRIDEGLHLIDKTLESTERTGHRTWEPESHRVRGELLCMANKFDDARMAFAEALRIAQAKEALGFELSVAMSLVRLERALGQTSRSRALLASVYARFSEGFHTKELMEAKALLDG